MCEDRTRHRAYRPALSAVITSHNERITPHLTTPLTTENKTSNLIDNAAKIKTYDLFIHNLPLIPNVRRLTFSLEIFSGHVVLHFYKLINKICCCLFSELEMCLVMLIPVIRQDANLLLKS